MSTYIMGAFSSFAITTKATPYPPTDLDHEIFLPCAIDGLADYLVSEDHALVNSNCNYSNFTIGGSADLALRADMA
jgi:hypothetical protein